MNTPFVIKQGKISLYIVLQIRRGFAKTTLEKK